MIIELPEIPNIKPPPPTDAMLVKMLTNNTNGAAALVDAYGNAYENPMFSNDPVYQVGVETWKRGVGGGAGAAEEENAENGAESGGGGTGGGSAERSGEAAGYSDGESEVLEEGAGGVRYAVVECS